MLADSYFKSAYAYFCPSSKSVLYPAGSESPALHSPARMLNSYKKHHKSYILKRFVAVVRTKTVIPLGG
ncbi:MAG: hypothetical protein AABY26_07030 [Nanoarchaeota archaeon]